MKLLLAALAAATGLLVLGGGAVAVPSPAVDNWWLSGSIQGDRFELQAGSYAELHARTPEAKALAAQLVGDHRHALNDSRALALRLHFTVPRAASGMQQWLFLNLKQLKLGTRFDQAYTSLEVQDHMQAITNAQLEIKAGKYPQVVSMAKKQLKMLKVHLMLSQKAWTATV